MEYRDEKSKKIYRRFRGQTGGENLISKSGNKWKYNRLFKTR